MQVLLLCFVKKCLCTLYIRESSSCIGDPDVIWTHILLGDPNPIYYHHVTDSSDEIAGLHEQTGTYARNNNLQHTYFWVFSVFWQRAINRRAEMQVTNNLCK